MNFTYLILEKMMNLTLPFFGAILGVFLTLLGGILSHLLSVEK